MTDMAQADRTLRQQRGDNERVFARFEERLARVRDEYAIYLACADDGNGGDITRGGAPLLSFNEWLLA